jgi:type II secretory pathway component PulK
MRATATRRGVVLLMAVGLLAVMGLLMVLITVRMTSDVKRSSRHATAAQVRQLTLAAATIARGQLERDATADGAIDLPGELSDSSLSLANWTRSVSRATVTIRVSRLDRVDEQTAEFERTNSGWRLLALRS